MQALTHHEITIILLSIAALLGVARLLGELARRFHQPAVMGEILAGILLGPTILGVIAPDLSAYLFPADGAVPVVLKAVTSLAVVLFLLMAGMEVDLSIVVRLRRSALVVGLCGLILPLAMGFTLGQIVPRFMGMEDGADKLVFSLFIGVALAISALPVIAKTLIDLKLFRTDFGMIIIAAAIVHDLLGWMIFAVILGMMAGNTAGGGDASQTNIMLTIGGTLLFVAFMLTIGRWLIDRILPWLQAHTSWPGGVMGFVITLGLLGAALTEWLGIHAIFGAFVVGIALGDSSHLQQHTRHTFEQFTSSVFAPLFFASIGLSVNFAAHFDLPLVLTVLLIACLGQVLGSATGAWWAGFPKRQSWAIGLALNARGAMEIVLAMLALQFGVIGERLFVALVIMALATSLVAGPLMQIVLRRKKPARFRQHLTSRGFVPHLAATTRDEALRELSDIAADLAGLPRDAVHVLVLERERNMSTALPGGLATPHARISGLSKPVVVAGLSHEGVDFDAADGRPARLIVMILTPTAAAETQLEMLADIATTFQSEQVISQAVHCASFTEFLALLNMHEPAEVRGVPVAAA